ncbi:hypothetical protein GWI33_011108 [Rhynchophorus ferrugineus]|uniref:Nucleoporin p58/p45 n=1 Tax=Rhynchophorus ferrugineus TaxID=354439 RepID=A0A834MM39_RHYFE|nr:hypothetical protein GWI33_011108 [Rhynchophorus ferrugineus]
MATGFNFGAKTTAAPSFGTGSLTFGTAAPQVQGGFSFNTTPATSTTTPSLFGPTAPAATTAGSSLFSGTTPGLFGTNPNPTTSSFSFGTNTLPSSTGLTFGTSTLPSGTGLSFGTPANIAAPTTGISFGTPATTTSTLSFGLSNTTTTTSAPTLAFNLTNTVNSSTPSFGFGNNTATTSTPGLSFNLSTPATTTTTSTTNSGLFGLGGANTATTFIDVKQSTVSVSVGLGGVATTQEKNADVTAQKEVPPKDQRLPNEILQTVDAFKAMVKEQRNHSSDITRCSVKDFRLVEQEIGHLNNQINEIESQLQKNRHLAEKLKYDTAKTVQNVEMAQRTHDTPAGLQYENVAPLKFFLDLADQFERDMQNLKIQIEAADKYVKNNKNPDSLTPQDLSMGMRRLHETFVALAGRLQSVHTQVESQKETYQNIRKTLLQDTSNPFDTSIPKFQMLNMQNNLVTSPPKVATGPTPFNNLAFVNTNVGSQQNMSPQTYTHTGSNTGTGFTVPLGSNQPSNTSLFGFGQTGFGNSFQLQKPPTGNKRGKI